MRILNRLGHSISYSEVKGLETEFAYSIDSHGSDVPDGIQCNPNLATASVWDNNDSNIETLDGKDIFHATVGHTYQNVIHDADETVNCISVFRGEKKRRKFVGIERKVPAFRKSLNKTVISSSSTSASELGTESTSNITTLQVNPERVTMTVLDLYWFSKLREGETPMHSGFMSQNINDPLPIQRICYMDPILSSPTSNDVVRETMVRTLNVATEINQILPLYPMTWL